MAVAMARMLRNGELVFNGVGSILPVLAIEIGRRLYAPDLVYLNIAGGIDPQPRALPYSSCDPELLKGTAAIVDQVEFYQLLMRGGIDLMFMGAVQIDAEGRTNSTVIGPLGRPTVRLPGGGGAAVVLPLARRVVIWRARHDVRTFVPKLDFVTAAGNVERVVTPLCVLCRGAGGFRVESLHPGVTTDDIRARTGFPLEIGDPPETPAPTHEEMTVIEDFDPHNHRSLDFT
jgi:glutaconate CoA-transferase subunit B